MPRLLLTTAESDAGTVAETVVESAGTSAQPIAEHTVESGALKI